MKLTVMEDTFNDRTTWTLVIDHREMITAPLDEFDHALLRDCDREGAPICDVLLGLETLTRRIDGFKGAVVP